MPRDPRSPTPAEDLATVRARYEAAVERYDDLHDSEFGYVGRAVTDTERQAAVEHRDTLAALDRLAAALAPKPEGLRIHIDPEHYCPHCGRPVRVG